MDRHASNRIIEKLQMEPLPGEGGLYRQTYRTQQATAILYMLEGDSFSHFHRLVHDEIYHFYLGDPVCLWELLPDGSIRETILGGDVCGGQEVQHIVRAGTWQGSCRLASFAGEESGDSFGYALLGTTMSPPYRQEEYEHGDRKALLAAYPDAGAAVLRLTNP